jgi:putative transposase
MPRVARDRSKSGIYHIILRGANRQEIFHDDQDCVRFLETLDKYKKKGNMKLYGWCLMGNHIHLLLAEGSEDISLTMKRIGVSYAWYYNWKYKTTGHLFQDRYRSEKVENDEYLLTAIRYIHQNPVKAKMSAKAYDWRWSSCEGYLGKPVYPASLLDSELILGMYSMDNKTAVRKFMEYNESDNEDQCLEDNERKRWTDEEARAEIQNLITDCKLTEIKGLPKERRDKILKDIKGIEGISQRQVARIVGVSQTLVFKA